MTGNTDHYEVFPEWYSLAILPVMLAMIAFFATLRNAKGKEASDAGR